MNLLLMLHMPKQNTGAKDCEVLGMITLGPLNIFCPRGNSSVLIRGDKYAVQIHTLDIQTAWNHMSVHIHA